MGWAPRLWWLLVYQGTREDGAHGDASVHVMLVGLSLLGSMWSGPGSAHRPPFSVWGVAHKEAHPLNWADWDFLLEKLKLQLMELHLPLELQFQPELIH